MKEKDLVRHVTPTSTENQDEEGDSLQGSGRQPQNHLKLHGQSLGNGEEADGSDSSVESWLELKKIITQENSQGKDLSSQLIQHSKLHTNFMTGLRWIGQESFYCRHNFSAPS